MHIVSQSKLAFVKLLDIGCLLLAKYLRTNNYRSTAKYCILLISIVFFANSTLFAQNLISFPVGEYWLFPDARTLGLAGGGSVSNSSLSALLLNPATMAMNEPGMEFMVSSRGRSLQERRSFPLFDRFEDINALNTYVVNSNLFWSFQGGAQYSFGKSPIPYLKSVAVGAFNEVDQEYEYIEEVRENVFPDDPLAFNAIQFSGKLTRISAGAAFQVDRLSLGLQAGVLTGNLDQRTSVTFVDVKDENLSQSTTRSKSNTPIVATLGATYMVTPHFHLGSHFRLPYTIDYAVTTISGETISSTESINYPGQLTVGFEFRGQQSLQARLNADFTYEWWSNTEASLYGANLISGNSSTIRLEDAIQVKAGIEHIFFNQMPFQVGIQYRTLFQERGNTRLMFTAGTGFMGKMWEVGLAGGISKNNYFYPDLFDDSIYGGDRSNNDIDDVEEIYTFMMLTLKVGVR